jgi:hypothetical protein
VQEIQVDDFSIRFIPSFSATRSDAKFADRIMDTTLSTFKLSKA